MLAEIQLLSGHPSDSLGEYRLSLKSDPNRFNALLGAADAALQSGQRAAALAYYKKLLKNCSGASGPALAELDRARAELRTSPSRTAYEPEPAAIDLAATHNRLKALKR